MTNTEVAVVESERGLSVRQDQTGWTDRQRAALIAMGVDESTSPADLELFLATCQRSGLDPFTKQIYLITRRTRQGPRATVQTGIDGLRIIATRTGEYLGQTGPHWCASDGSWSDMWPGTAGPPAAARVTVRRWVPAAGMVADFPAVAHWDEYVSRESSGAITRMWTQFPALMLGKCAEALALRKAFPQDMSGLYTSDEMAQSANPAPAPAPSPPRTPAPITAHGAIEAAAELSGPDTQNALRELWTRASHSGVLDTETEESDGLTVREILTRMANKGEKNA